MGITYVLHKQCGRAIHQECGNVHYSEDEDKCFALVPSGQARSLGQRRVETLYLVHFIEAVWRYVRKTELSERLDGRP